MSSPRRASTIASASMTVMPETLPGIVPTPPLRTLHHGLLDLLRGRELLSRMGASQQNATPQGWSLAEGSRTAGYGVGEGADSDTSAESPQRCDVRPPVAWSTWR